MSRASPPGLRILHAVRVLGFADTGAIADRAGAPEGEVRVFLRGAEARGWTRESAFADLRGWSLTDAGRVENERQLERERLAADPHHVVDAVYREFLPLNARLLRACTDWQLTRADDGRLVPNDHTDSAGDARVLDELATLGEALVPLVTRLTAVLARFTGYDARWDAALARAARGEHHWVDATSVDSCHRVWFQLHEDLLATLGRDRGAEPAGDTAR